MIPKEFDYPAVTFSHAEFKDPYETMAPLRREILS
jgi:hypothetical protein